MFHYIIHHNDDDGYCAAAIAIGQCMPTTVSEDKTFCYYHGAEAPAIPYDNVTDDDHLIIVDLALDAVILDLIRRFRAAAPNAMITHIDHHKSTFDTLKKLTPEDTQLMESVYTLYKQGISAALLTWIWYSMNDEERKDPMSVPFDFMPQMTHVGLWPENAQGHEERLYFIPSIIRWVDDWDVWKHELQDTREFHYGFMLEENKSPFNKDLWSPALFDRNIEYLLQQLYINPGRTVLKFIEQQNKWLQKTAAEVPIYWKESEAETEWHRGIAIAINADGNSEVFGDLINEYDIAMLWNYDGSINAYTYSLYTVKDNIDTSLISQWYGGGGHPKASGFQNDYDPFTLFEKLVVGPWVEE